MAKRIKIQELGGFWTRPFVTDGDPQNVDVAIIGLNPATPVPINEIPKEKDWYQLITSRPKFLEFYKKLRLRKKKPGISKTRKRLEIIGDCFPQYKVSETNVNAFPTKNISELNKSEYKDDGAKIAREYLDRINPKIVIIHSEGVLEKLEQLGVLNSGGREQSIGPFATYHMDGTWHGNPSYVFSMPSLAARPEGWSEHAILTIAEQINSLVDQRKREGDFEGFYNLELNAASPEAFLEFWAQRYSDPQEEIYKKNIGEKKTQKVIDELFLWKNGGKLAKKKRESVRRNYGPFDGVKKSKKELLADPDLKPNMSKDSAIWRIFWLHCQNPVEFPIYDQHVHRAMMYIHGYREKDAEIPDSNKKRQTYILIGFYPS